MYVSMTYCTWQDNQVTLAASTPPPPLLCCCRTWTCPSSGLECGPWQWRWFCSCEGSKSCPVFCLAPLHDSDLCLHWVRPQIWIRRSGLPKSWRKNMLQMPWEPVIIVFPGATETGASRLRLTQRSVNSCNAKHLSSSWKKQNIKYKTVFKATKLNKKNRSPYPRLA